MAELRRNAPKRASAGPELIVVAGREIAVSNPAKVLFPKPKYTKRDLVRYYLAVAEGALRGAGPAERAGALPQRHHRRVLLSEAGAGIPPAVDRRGYAALPLGSHRGGGRATRRRRARMARQPRLPGAASASGAHRGPRP